MAQCPRCKGDLPLLSKICPKCQHVIEGDETSKAEELINHLDLILLKIKNVPKPTFGDSLRDMLYIVIPVMTIYFLILALISGSGMFWILGGAGGLMSLYTTIRKVIAAMKPGPNALELLRNEYDYNENIARRSFGKHPEALRHIGLITGEVTEIEATHRASKRHNLYLWGVIGLGFLVLGSGGVIATSLTTDEPEPTELLAPWQEKINAYKNSADNDQYGGADARVEVLKEILANKEYTAAEGFFFDHCQGKVGDVECAKTVMRAYMADGNTDKAMGFVNRIVLRYASDVTKLKKLINEYGTVQ